MGENFVKFKNKALKIRLIKSILAGASLGLFVSGLLLLLSKFELLTLKPVFGILIGVGAFILLGGALYLVLYKSDMALAKHLDERFNLDERVETMLQYKDEDSPIHRLQREDTDKRLSEIPLSELKFDRLWIYIVAPIIGVMMLVSSFIFSPIEQPPPEKEEIPFAITEMQIAALEELIAYVGSSEMQSPYREEIMISLDNLLLDIKDVDTVSEKDTLVLGTMQYVMERTDLSSFAVELMAELWRSDVSSVKKFAQAINYYGWPKADEWDKFSSQITTLRTTFIHTDTLTDNPDEEKMVSETAALFIKASAGIEAALLASGMPADDLLYKVLLRYAGANEVNEDGTRVYGLITLAEYIHTVGYTDAERELDATFTALNGELFKALSQHRENTSTGEYAMKRLSEIFGCTALSLERPNFYEYSGPGATTPGNDEGGGGGGAIGGDTVYGSDDLVLDPDTNTYVEYGTILDKYYAIVFGKIQNGDYTEEEKAAMEKYFNILYAGFGEEDEQ